MKKIIIIILCILIILTLIIIFAIPNYYKIKAKEAGATDKQIEKFINEKSIHRWHFCIKNTPGKKYNIIENESEIDKDIPTLCIFYLFECPDCEKAFNTIKEEIEKLPKDAQNNVCWIQTGTKNGKVLKLEYGVEHVPSSVTLYKDEQKLNLLYDLNTGDTKTELIKDVFKEYATYYK